MDRDNSSAAPPQQLVHIGLLLAADERDADLHARYQAARDRLLGTLAEQFPQFEWQITVVHRRRFSPLGAIDPLAVVEFAVQEKTERRWDYVLAVVPNELNFRDRAATWGVPSSALEVALITTAMVSSREALGDELVAMSLHLLGHLWGLDHHAEGPMCPAGTQDGLRISPFPADQRRAAAERLEEVADARIEEEPTRLGAVRFYWRTFMADPRGIVNATWSYDPWKLPFRFGRLTSGALTFLVVLLLTAESWEVGVNVSAAALAGSTVGAVLASALFLFVGQNLGKMSGPGLWLEQWVRTRIVIFASLLVGMIALWALLAATAFLVGLAMPEAVLSRWLSAPHALTGLLRYAAFMATLGLFGGALGGSLEDEGNFKPKFLFDEEP